MKKRNIVCLVLLVCIVSSMLLPVCAMGIGNDTVEPQRYYATGKVVYLSKAIMLIMGAKMA